MLSADPRYIVKGFDDDKEFCQLLGKWLWRLGDRSEGLWRKVLMVKYGNQKDGWEIKDNRHRFPLMWKGITSVKEKFMQNIKYQVCLGEKILFWKDIWIVEYPQQSSSQICLNVLW